MSARAQTVRLTPAQQRTLAGFARTYGLSEYAMLARIVDDGLAALVERTGDAVDAREMIGELAAMSTRLVDVERMIDRALFTACAAYCYARSGATRAESRNPQSYEKGDVVRFTRDFADKGVSRGEAYRVERIDPAKAAITLKSESGRDVDWRLRQWGAGHSQTFVPQSLELKAGDNIRFTRNDRDANRINGLQGEVLAIDQASRTATVQVARGQTQILNLDKARDQHLAHAYVETAFAAQGRTADHVMIHADSRATNLIDQKSFYVGVSRARESVAIFTNDRAKLVSAISERAGLVQTATAQAEVSRPVAEKRIGAGLG